MSLIAFGQSDTIIKPVHRFIQNGDTMTTFTLNGERMIATRIGRGLELATENKLLKQSVTSFMIERDDCKAALKTADKTIAQQNVSIKHQEDLTKLCGELYVVKQQECDALRSQRTKIIIIGVLLVAVALVF